MFAYGSLMGDSVLAAYPAQAARLSAYHRSFNHASRQRWGRPEAPCPILGLSPGGECWGVVFDVPRAEESAVLRALERREAASERERRTLAVDAGGAPVEAWVWLSRPASHSARGEDVEELVARLRAAHGTVGRGVEYVRGLIHALELYRIHDALIEALWQRLRP